MNASRSHFTEAIEDHLALKKQNVGIETAMPLARYDVGDPLDRYPGGATRGIDPATVAVTEDSASVALDPSATPAPGEVTQFMVGPSPEQAMEAATALEPSFGDRPFEPLTAGMTPMLSLVEDIDDEDETGLGQPPAPANAEVLRFPGGVGPREDDMTASTTSTAAPMATHAFSMPMETTPANATVMGVIAPTGTAVTQDAPTGEQPVIVIDTDEPLAMSGEFTDEPPVASRSERRTTKPRFFGLGRKKAEKEQADGWFTDGPRDFDWE